jgi:GT2 family glycosyltransferase
MASAPIIVVCSANRPVMLHESVLSLVRQTAACDIIVSVPDDTHVLPETRKLAGVIVVKGAHGLCAQRNAALRHLRNEPSAVFFFDDDVEVDEEYVSHMLRAFDEEPDMGLGDGLKLGLEEAPGSLNRQTARELIRRRKANPASDAPIEEVRTGIGCKMCVRGTLLGKVSFDERLVLYGYQEDFDFSLECKQYGRIVLNRRCLMVHIETEQGRMARKKRGYSEVVNPFYIWTKGRGPHFIRTFGGAIRRTLKNALRCHTAAGRRQFAGNVIGWYRLASGEFDPEFILRLD